MWLNLPTGERPLLHGNHDEAILYANQGNQFAWVSNDSYHLKPKGEGTSIMVVVCLLLAQPILTQMSWYNHSDPVTGTIVRVH